MSRRGALAPLLALLLMATGTVRAAPSPMRYLTRNAVYTNTATVQWQLHYLAGLARSAFPGEFRLTTLPPIKAVSPALLQQLGGEQFAGDQLEGLYDGRQIWISDGMYRDMSLMVVAHELGHVWQHARHPDPAQISEGFAEGFADWFAVQLLKRAGFTHMCSLIEHSPDPIYGRGCRWFLRLEKHYGIRAVLSVAFHWYDFDGRRVPGKAPVQE